ncbi:MAG: PqqD family protein [Clostridia bacterium]|nr:PqqD family protein [Clostridia bacterium]
MKIKKEVVFRSVAGENMLIPVGETVGEYNGIFSMTEVGAEIWQAIENGSNEKQIVDLISSEYEIDSDTAKADVKSFIDKLCEFGIVER